jgi:cobalamin biosynthesis protein CobD/CbiB
MKYFSSILGFLIMLIVPVIVIGRYRWFFKKRKYDFGNLNQSFIKGTCGYFIIVILALGILSMIIYGFIKNIPAKTCVNENVTFFDFLG